jgi:hypothetical protein
MVNKLSLSNFLLQINEDLLQSVKTEEEEEEEEEEAFGMIKVKINHPDQNLSRQCPMAAICSNNSELRYRQLK